MLLPRFRPAFRRLALSLAAAQLLAYAAAPVLEALTEHATAPVAIEGGHSKACFPVHQPATCFACQMLTMSARRADGTAVSASCEDRAVVADRTFLAAAPRAPPLAYLTRAPPRTLG